MSIEELREKLRDLGQETDAEAAHSDADEALLDYINDDEVTEAFNDMKKWYA